MLDEIAPAHDDELLARDIHPAELCLADGTVQTGLRVFVTSSRIVAYRAREDRSIERVLTAPLTETVHADRSTLQGPLTVMTSGGRVIVNRGHGCGCHSPLKALRPPAPWRR